MHVRSKLNRQRFLIGLGLVLGLLHLGSMPGAAQEQNSGAPGDWLSRYQSARSLGLGGSFVATADDPLGTVWNPAGLTLLYRNRFHTETARLFDDTAVNGVSLGIPSGRLPGFGLTMLSLGSDGFERTDDMNNLQGNFGIRETAFMLSVTTSTGHRVAERDVAPEDMQPPA